MAAPGTNETVVNMSTGFGDDGPAGGALADVLAGADVGLALFDEDLNLLACNELYRVLCGYSKEEAHSGTPMRDLMRRSLERQGVVPDEIQKTIENALSHLRPGNSYTFRYTASGGKMVEVRRRRLPNMTAVETIRAIDEANAHDPLSTQYEQIAETARTRMIQALDVMADGFSIYDSEDRLVVYNRKYVELNPHIADLIAPGATYQSMLEEGIRRGGFKLNDMDAEQFLAWRLRQHQNPGEAHEVQLSDGRWVLVHERRAEDGSIVGIRSDITERKQREFEMLRISRELHAKNVQFDTALNNMIQGLCMFDADQVLIVCNTRYLELYGFSPDVVKSGITLRQIMEYSVNIGNYTPEEAERALAERPDPKRLSKRTTIKQRLRDGRVIAVMSEPMRDGGSIATYQDITELEQHELKQRIYTEKLERSNRELQDFAYVASHDLQEPLRKIEAFGDRLVTKYKDLLPEDGQTYVDRMQDAASRMRRLISDLLDYSRVTTKAKPFVEIDMNELMGDVISDLQMRIDDTGAKVEFDSLPSIQADASQMHQLFLNLIGNALKFVKPDTPPVVAVRAELFDGEDAEGQCTKLCRFTIADNGIGFENEFKDQIFTIFQRLHGRLEYEGTGIGLATCRKIVERHSGTIDADGEPGVGATFTIVVPVERQKNEVET